MSRTPKTQAWFIVIQQRCAYNGLFPRDDFRAYRKWSVWPKVFPSSTLCEEFMRECFTFNGLTGRKLSASAMSIGQFRKVTQPLIVDRKNQWVKKSKGSGKIYTHPQATEGRAVVENHCGIFFNGRKFDNLVDAKAFALGDVKCP